MSVVITTIDKLRAVERELALRHRVYERWVSEDKMSAGKAELEIACMEAIRDDYAALLEKERLL